MFAEKDRLFDVEQRHQLIFEDASVAVLTADEGFGVQTAIFPHEVNDSAAVFFVVVFFRRRMLFVGIKPEVAGIPSRKISAQLVAQFFECGYSFV